MESFGEFNTEKETWECYFGRHEAFVENSTNIKGPVAHLISVMGPEAYGLLKNLVHPKKPREMPLAGINDIMNKYYSPPVLVIAERYKFHTAAQNEESVSQFLARLRKLARKCDFKDNLEENLRDRFVCGINDEAIRKRLLTEQSLTLQRAVDIAVGQESAQRDARLLHGGESTHVKKVTSPNKKRDSRTKETPRGAKKMECYRCLGNHQASQCRFRHERCYKCQREGHIAKACRGKDKASVKVHHATEMGEPESAESEDEVYTLNCEVKSVQPLMTMVKINGHDVPMEVDTGAGVTIINEDTWRKLGKPALEKGIKLRTYTKTEIRTLGKASMRIHYQDQEVMNPVVVVPGNSANLFGRDLLLKIRLNWNDICVVSPRAEVHQLRQKLKQDFPELFHTDKQRQVVDVKARITYDQNAQPRFHKPRPVPYAMRERVGEALDRMVEDGVLSPVEQSDWAAPIVPIVKPSGEIRVCGDYKVTINPVSKVESYPIPRVKDLLTEIGGMSHYTKLDLRHAYESISLDEESKPLTCINTFKGLFVSNVLPYGISSAPAIFQRIIENVIKDCPKAYAYLDDIVVCGSSEEECYINTRKVLEQLNRKGFTLQQAKCQFIVTSIEYLGHEIDGNGLKPLTKHVEAIQGAPRPRDTSSLKAYLGLLSFYRAYLPDLATMIEPLNELTRQGTPYKWGKRQEKAFEDSKKAIMTSGHLKAYDPDQPVELRVDASPYGIGALIKQQTRPVFCASRSLTNAERNYSQLDREALAVVYGVKQFHEFLYGKCFTIKTDHKPLLGLLGPDKAINHMSSPRMQRWGVTLSAYEYSLVWEPAELNHEADMLSRLPLATDVNKEEKPLAELVFTLECIESNGMSAKDIEVMTNKDPLLSQVKQFVENGWPTAKPVIAGIEHYWEKRNELSLHMGLLLWGSRVVIPEKGREWTLKTLHECHPGVVRMKGLARSSVWYPGIDKAIEHMVLTCHTCQRSSQDPAKAPPHPWVYPSVPWQRIHLDYAGPINGQWILIIVDAYSKWIDAWVTSTTSTAQTIKLLQRSFAIHGLCWTIVTDNGTCFTSSEFQDYLKSLNITHKLSAVYKPSSNGQAERMVRIIKEGLSGLRKGDLEDKLQRLLLSYRRTPLKCGRSPAELLMSRQVRTKIDQIRPRPPNDINNKPQSSATMRSFERDELVWVKSFSKNEHKWVPGLIQARKGSVNYSVRIQGGRVLERHLDQLKSRHAETLDQLDRQPINYHLPASCVTPLTTGQRSTYAHPENESADTTQSQSLRPAELTNSPLHPQPRRSLRTTKGIAPQRLTY